MKIQFKLILVGFMVIAVLMAVVGVVTVRAFNKISQSMSFVFTVVDPMDDAVSNLRFAFEEEIRAIEEYAGDFFTLETASEEIKESEEIINANFEKLSAAAAAAADLVTLKDVNQLRGIIAHEDELREEIFRLKIAVINEARVTSTILSKGAIGGELREKLEEFDDVVKEIDEVANSMRASILSVKEARTEEVAAAAAAAAEILLVGVIASVFLALGMGIFVSRSVAKPLADLRDVADAVSKGDFTKRAEVKGNDEIGQLAAAFNKMTDSLLESRKLPESILRSMKDSLFVVDTKGNITEVNQAGLEALGYKKEELVGKPISKVFSGRGTTRKLTHSTSSGQARKDAEKKPKVIKYIPAPDQEEEES